MVDIEQMFVYLNFAESAGCKHGEQPVWLEQVGCERNKWQSGKVGRQNCRGTSNISVRSLDCNLSALCAETCFEVYSKYKIQFHSTAPSVAILSFHTQSRAHILHTTLEKSSACIFQGKQFLMSFRVIITTSPNSSILSVSGSPCSSGHQCLI